MGTILSQVVGKLLGSGPVCDSECHHVQCCTSTQRVVDPVRSFWRKKRRIMTTVYTDSRKRETIQMQTDAKLSVFTLRVADTFLSTDRGHSSTGKMLANAAEIKSPLGRRPSEEAARPDPRTRPKLPKSVRHRGHRLPSAPKAEPAQTAPPRAGRACGRGCRRSNRSRLEGRPSM